MLLSPGAIKCFITSIDEFFKKYMNEYRHSEIFILDVQTGHVHYTAAKSLLIRDYKLKMVG